VTSAPEARKSIKIEIRSPNLTQSRTSSEMRAISLATGLFAFWLALSGHYTPFLTVSGALIALFCTAVAQRMYTIDDEAYPLKWLVGTVKFYPWLAVEIIKSTLKVTKLIWHPRLPISPTMTVVTAGQNSTVGIATYANSITLTPGTLTAGVIGNQLTIHALELEGAEDVEAGAMNQHVVAFEKVH
jgi:multicomponent Na+:H+ antiporter subunit E